MRSAIAWAFVCTTLGCTATEPKPEPSREDEVPASEPLGPPPGAWVVIDDRHGLFEGPDANARRIPIEQAEPGPRLRVAEIVANHEGFIELRTIADSSARGCAGSLGFEPSYQLHFFVEPEALHPVLARSKQLDFGDGTKLELAAGVPVIETGTTGRIQVGKTQLVVDIAAEDVARWWQPSMPDEPSETRPDSNIELHYGDRSFVAEWPPFLEYQETQDIEGGRLLTYVGACGRFVLRADKKSGLYAMKGPKNAIPRMARNFEPVVPQPEAGQFLASPYGGQFVLDSSDDPWAWAEFVSCNPLAWVAPARTPLLWPDDTEAGTVLVEHRLPLSAEDREGRVCFEASALDVCIETAKLRREGEAECTPELIADMVWGPLDAQTKYGPKPHVRQGKATVSKGLEPDLVRRIVGAHVNEVRGCYHALLKKHPKLAGRVVIAFDIGPNGKVTNSEVHETTDAFAETWLAPCFAKAVARWTFPKPKDGATVSVVYPFVLSAK